MNALKRFPSIPAATTRRIAVLAALLCWIATFAAPANAEVSIRDVTSAKGIHAWLVEDYSVPIVTIRFAFGGGSSQDPAGKEGLATAVAVREPSVVAYLVDVFERSWERGRAFTNRESTIVRDIAAEQRAMTIRMLIEGRADPVGAKRLGVSPRTYAAYVADLKNEFEVETRFQLGYEMGRAGVDGQETTADEG